MKNEEIIGKVFGRLTVLELSHRDKWRTAVFKCRCLCENISFVRRNSLLNGKTVSCGCFQKENISKLMKGNKHNKNDALVVNEIKYKNGEQLKYFHTELDLSTKNFIYKITNQINGKIYIGKSERSLRTLIYRYGREKISRPITNAIKKYGFNNFKLEIIDSSNDPLELNNKEIYWIKFYDTRNPIIGYNLTNGGDGIIGIVWSLESRKLASEKAKKRNMVGVNNPFYGKTHTEETKEKIRESNRRRTGTKMKPKEMKNND